MRVGLSGLFGTIEAEVMPVSWIGHKGLEGHLFGEKIEKVEEHEYDVIYAVVWRLLHKERGRRIAFSLYVVSKMYVRHTVSEDLGRACHVTQWLS